MKSKGIGILLLIAGLGVGLVTITQTAYSEREELSIPTSEAIDAGFVQDPVDQEESLPSRIVIPKLGIDTDVQHVGISKKGNMAVPTNFTDVGWYKYGTMPGNDGSAVIAGHQTDSLSRPAIFGRLNELEPGDEIYIIREDGKKLVFEVRREEIMPYDTKGPKMEEIFNRKGDQYLNLITCAGEWLPQAKTNDKRLVIYAELANN